MSDAKQVLMKEAHKLRWKAKQKLNEAKQLEAKAQKLETEAKKI